MKRLISIGKWLLIAWGAISLIGVIGIGGFIAYQLEFGNNDKIDSASVHDVRFVLNWCNLGESRIEKVIHSYQSARSFTGDHLDAYAIKISHVTPEELTTTNAMDAERLWYRGDKLPQVVSDAVDCAGASLGDEHIPWFPKETELRTDQFYVYPETIYYAGGRPVSVDLIFVNPTKKMVFYLSSKT